MTKPFLALLRGINVGGNNIISKDDLKGCFGDLGCTNVVTYIQSGNILFRSPITAIVKLTTLIEEELSRRFDYSANAVVLSRKKYFDAIAEAPESWGNDDEFKHNALFVLRGNTARSLLQKLPAPKKDIERVTAATGVIFWSVSKEHQTKSSMMKLAGTLNYQKVTVRNHNTVFRLQELFEEI